MSHVSILDCTLRDGAYLVDKRFGESTIKGIIDGLIKAKIEYIEIGFFQDDGFGEGKTVYKNSVDAMKYIPKEKNGCKFVVLADYSRYSFSNLDEKIEDGVDAIRVCFFKSERYDAVETCRLVINKGYRCFVQPVDILGYTDKELIELIECVNEIEPFGISIVDTFGSMYQEDLERVVQLMHHNLGASIRIGFHSHNNMQMSSALSQDFIRITQGKRKVVVDATLSGMGRGAGNTPTELIVQYMVDKYAASYDMDSLLDVIDAYMGNIRYKCSWGYSTEYFIAGAYGAHVNNISYLTMKNSIRSKDIRFILNKIGKESRKRYDYDLLEKTYIEMLNSQYDDSENKNQIKRYIGSSPVLIIAPGSTIDVYRDRIEKCIMTYNPVIITVNFFNRSIKSDFLYMNNRRRYQEISVMDGFKDINKIFTSNFNKNECDENTIVVSFPSLVKCGWESIDNSMLMLLRLLSDIDVSVVLVAGFDGYENNNRKRNYLLEQMEIDSVGERAMEINEEIYEMLIDFNKTRKRENMKIEFITPSRFENAFEK